MFMNGKPIRYRILLAVTGLLLVLGSGCSTQKRATRETPAERVVRTALTYEGVPYRFGGNDRSGLDCSGLIHLAIEQEGLEFPRVSYRMYDEGRKIGLDKVRPGDLLFFRTQRTRRKVNHVGLVVRVRRKEIFFIHSTSQRGVIVSSLREEYWKDAFKRAKRVL